MPSNAEMPVLAGGRTTGLPAGTAPALLALIVAACAMGASPIFVRLADIGPFASAFWRVTLALPVLWLWMKAEDAAVPRSRRAGFTLPAVLAGAAFSCDLFFWHLSALHTTVANATFFATMAPIWVVVFGWLLFRRRVDRAVMAGLALCLVGGAALVAQSLAFRPDHTLGDVFGLLTGVFFGLYFLAVGAARTSTGAARVTFQSTVVTAACLGVVAVLFEPRLIPLSGSGWGVLLMLALVCHVGGQGLLSVALGRLPTTFSSLVIFLEAIAAAALAWALFGEAVTPVQGFGGIVILAGIWVARPRAAIR